MQEVEYFSQVDDAAAEKQVVAPAAGIAQVNVEKLVLEGIHSSLWAYCHEIHVGKIDCGAYVFCIDRV